YADPTKPNTMPPQTATTIGDQLDDANVTWAWYSGAWTSTSNASIGARTGFPQSGTPNAAPNFQFHHQPFNYYAAFDPVTGAAEPTAHLKDESEFVHAAATGTLPQVSFYKPQGDLNEHPGYAALGAGDQHLADVIQMLEASPQWDHMMIIVTYDENGGWWDH